MVFHVQVRPRKARGVNARNLDEGLVKSISRPSSSTLGFITSVKDLPHVGWAITFNVRSRCLPVGLEDKVVQVVAGLLAAVVPLGEEVYIAVGTGLAVLGLADVVVRVACCCVSHSFGGIVVDCHQVA